MDFGLYLITDRRLVDDLPGAVDRALSALPRGAAAVQLREKDLGASALLELALRVGEVCRRRGAPLLINDRIDVALAARADGVHLAGGSVEVEEARSLGVDLVGASCHDEAELDRRGDADFVVCSPIFPSPGKGPAVGIDALHAAAATGMRVFALGGVDRTNAAACTWAGAQGVAAIRAWLAAADPAEAVAALHDLVASGKAGRFSQGASPPRMTAPRALC